ncbi:MAG: hypothetical protein H6706_11420 [Myxococcales bacterium]|nr:hypothetical protein [Myxococcales bacterium]
MLRAATLALAALTLTACGAAAPALRAPAMEPMAVAAPPVLDKNHFQQDRMGNVTETAMREILAAPVFLEERARIGVVPVVSRYELSRDVPVETVTGGLTRNLIDNGFFEVVSEVTTDWPGATSVGGLRELATRYRAEYLLLYRHRFVEREMVNGWGWAWLTLVGGMIMPQNTYETAGVMEATLFDVKTGTLLFTVYERVHAEEDFNVWNNDWKVRRLREGMITEATEKLAQKVDARVRDLVAARPVPRKDEAVARAPANELPAP